MSIMYQIGDATDPIGGGPRIIVHVCNDAGGWGKGFVIAVSRRWPEPERRYRAWHRGEEPVAHWSLLIAILAASDFSRAMANCCGRHLF